MAVNYLIEEALTHPDSEYWYVAPTYRQAKQIAWRMILKQIRKLPKELQGRKHESELWVEVGRSRIALKGADNEDTLRGSGLAGMVIDEAASISSLRWKFLWGEALRPSLSDVQGWAWFISTPKGFNHFYDLYLTENKDNDFKSFRFSSIDNPYFPPDEFEKAKKESSEEAFAQEYLADFRKHTGLIYKNFDRKVHVINPFPIPIGWQKYRAFDFGFTDPTVCLWIAVDNDRNLYVYDEYYQRGQTTKSHCEVVKLKSGADPYAASWGDPSAMQWIFDYAQYGIFIAPAIHIVSQGMDWVVTGIDKIYQLLDVNYQSGKPKLFIFAHCVNTIKEFETYHWIEARGDVYTKERPSGEFNHSMDALRYFVVSYFAGQRPIREDRRIW